MEQTDHKETIDKWNAITYADGNFIQKAIALKAIDQLLGKDELRNQAVLHIGCGTSNTSYILSQLAQHVHGIDSSESMINYSQQKYLNKKNMSYEKISAENFTPAQQFDIAVIFSCLNHIDNKKKALEKINLALSNNGILIGTFITKTNALSITIKAGLRLARNVEQIYPSFNEENLQKKIESSFISDDAFKKMLNQSSFDICSYTKLIFDYPLKDRTSLEKYCRPLSINQLIKQFIPKNLQENSFQEYVTLILNDLKKNNLGQYLFPVDVTIFKVKKIGYSLELS